MRYLTLLLLSYLLLACQATNRPNEPLTATATGIPFYLGTYDDPGIHEPGIYRFLLHPDGTVTNDGRMAEAHSPSFLALSPDRRTIVTVEELNGKPGNVVSFRVQDDTLLLHNRQPAGGVGPCHVAISPQRTVAVANYVSGTVQTMPLATDGTLGQPSGFDQHTRGEDEPHAHSNYFLEEGRQMISADLGTDQIWYYDVEPATGQIRAREPATVDLTDGAGPRHLAIHPNGRWIYAINELNSTVTQLNYDGEKLTAEQAWSTLPDAFDGESFCADIHISADGKFLYGSNRGHNSIAVFGIDAAGKLELLETESVAGDWPRNFALSPDERFLLVANQRSKNITVLGRDPKTGLLDYVSTSPAPVPVCILF